MPNLAFCPLCTKLKEKSKKQFLSNKCCALIIYRTGVQFYNRIIVTEIQNQSLLAAVCTYLNISTTCTALFRLILLFYFYLLFRVCADPVNGGAILGEGGTGSPRREQGASVEPRQGKRKDVIEWEDDKRTRKTAPTWLQDASMHRVS